MSDATLSLAARVLRSGGSAVDVFVRALDPATRVELACKLLLSELQSDTEARAALARVLIEGTPGDGTARGQVARDVARVAGAAVLKGRGRSFGVRLRGPDDVTITCETRLAPEPAADDYELVWLPAASASAFRAWPQRPRAWSRGVDETVLPVAAAQLRLDAFDDAYDRLSPGRRALDNGHDPDCDCTACAAADAHDGGRSCGSEWCGRCTS